MKTDDAKKAILIQRHHFFMLNISLMKLQIARKN
jgi:hypothetical protein